MKIEDLTNTADIPPQPPEHIPDHEVLEAYYEDSSKDYLVRDSHARYMRVTESALRRMLKSSGFNAQTLGSDSLSGVDEQLRRIQLDKRIFYAGPLAGYDAGVYNIEGRLILVTESPKLVNPVAGPLPLIEEIISQMLDRGVLQSVYLLGWLKIAVENLRFGGRSPGQALVIAGERECGKSLLQAIITELFGGRSAKPYQYMTGSTTFNAELFGAEHLMIEDESASTSLQARRHFGAYLKQIAANSKQRHHGKNKTALTLEPFWRLSVSVNDEPENLLVLPPLDESLRDKVILLRAEKRPMPMQTGTPREKEAFWKAIKAELPAFVHFLLEFDIPESLLSARYGITHFHHPALLEAIEELAPETIFIELIDEHLFSLLEERWEGTATELERELRKTVSYAQLDKVLTYRSACGTYLARLMKKMPERISFRRYQGSSKIWTIQPPRTKANLP